MGNINQNLREIQAVNPDVETTISSGFGLEYLQMRDAARLTTQEASSYCDALNNTRQFRDVAISTFTFTPIAIGLAAERIKCLDLATKGYRIGYNGTIYPSPRDTAQYGFVTYRTTY